jgi:hypothetical protein
MPSAELGNKIRNGKISRPDGLQSPEKITLAANNFNRKSVGRTTAFEPTGNLFSN